MHVQRIFACSVYILETIAVHKIRLLAAKFRAGEKNYTRIFFFSRVRPGILVFKEIWLGQSYFFLGFKYSKILYAYKKYWSDSSMWYWLTFVWSCVCKVCGLFMFCPVRRLIAVFSRSWLPLSLSCWEKTEPYVLLFFGMRLAPCLPWSVCSSSWCHR